MRSRVRLLLPVLLVAGCKLPPPDPHEVPEAPRLLSKVRPFTLYDDSGRLASSASLEGKPLVVLACEAGFVRDLLTWREALEGRYGKPGERWGLLLVAGGSTKALRELALQVPEGTELHADADGSLAVAFGLVGEGPHVLVVGPEGKLLARIDGTVDFRARERLYFALGGLLPRVDVK